MRLAPLAYLMVVLAGCSGAGPLPLPRAELPPPPASRPVLDDPVAQARAERDDLVERLGQAEARVGAAERARDDAQRDRLRAVCWWVTGCCLLLAVAAGALAFFLPAGKRLALTAAGVLVAAACLAQLAAAALAYLLWIGLGGAAIGIGMLVWSARGSRDVTEELCQTGTEALLELEAVAGSAKANAIREAAAVRQSVKRVQGPVASIVARHKAALKAKRPAVAA
jgi:predicted small lipoprotein YifL